MKKKIITAIICLVLVVASVFTTLHVSNIYNFRKELIGVIERERPYSIEKIVDVIEFDDTVITVFTGGVNKYVANIGIFIAFFDNNYPDYTLKDVWEMDKYKDTKNFSNVQHKYISDDSIFLTFSRMKKIKERKDSYTYRDYKIEAYNRVENYTLSYRVSTEVEYPIFMKYYDYGLASYDSTNVVSLFVDKDNVLYVATKKKNLYEDYDLDTKIENSKDFENAFKNLKITKKQLDKQMVEEIYNSFLNISGCMYWASDSDDMDIRIGDLEFFTTVSDYYDDYDSEDSYINSAYMAQSGLFELLNQYFTYEDVNIKFGER